MYYFDHSATTPVHPEVSELMDHIQSTTYGNPSSMYSAGQKAKGIIESHAGKLQNQFQLNPNKLFLLAVELNPITK